MTSGGGEASQNSTASSICFLTSLSISYMTQVNVVTRCAQNTFIVVSNVDVGKTLLFLFTPRILLLCQELDYCRLETAN